MLKYWKDRKWQFQMWQIHHRRTLQTAKTIAFAYGILLAFALVASMDAIIENYS